jgi:hypothetical protein
LPQTGLNLPNCLLISIELFRAAGQPLGSVRTVGAEQKRPMNPPSALNVLLTAILFTTVWLGHAPIWASPSVGLIDFNAGPGDFTVVSTNNPGGPWAYDAVGGTWSAFDTNDCGAVAFRSSRLNSPILTVPAAGSVMLSFDHRYSFEADTTRWDGGQLRISINGGAYVTVPTASFTANGYNDTVGGADVPNNELAGQSAFTAQSADYDLGAHITSAVTLGTFNANDTLSIQFLGAWDDCAQGTVPNWEIKRVEFSPSLEDRRPPPAFTDLALPADAAVAERHSYTLRAAPLGHVSVQWFKDMVAIPGANNTSYTIARVTAADAGQYFLQAINSIGSSTSRVATLSFIPDTTPPAILSARCGANADEINIVLSEPLELDNGAGFSLDDPFGWTIETVAGPGADPGVLSVSYTAGDTIIHLTAPSGSLDYSLNTYRVVLQEFMIDTAAAHNVLPAGSSVAIKCPHGIPVESTGAGPFTFDTLPLSVEFSTVSWPGTANGTADTPAIVNGRVQLLDASTINLPLAEAPGTPPVSAGTAQWASAGRYLITRPTATFGDLLLARLQNDSGATRTTVDISYNLTVESFLTEQIPGHLVYYSLTGAPSSWRQIPGISGATGLKSATLNLSATPWTVGSLLYILWVDDNGSGSPDSAVEIDNFSVTLRRPALLIRYSTSLINVTWPPGSGVLQSKGNLADPTWTDVPGAGSSGSATLPAGGSSRFFVLRAP